MQAREPAEVPDPLRTWADWDDARPGFVEIDLVGHAGGVASNARCQPVAARARSLASVLGADADLVEAAAWLYDIGYALGLAVTGLHALDGARYLRDARHADAMLCRLVAHHSCTIIEAEECGFADVLSLEFEPAPYALSSVLTYCDMTTSPDGELAPVDRRLAEIHDRYGQGHLVNRSIQRATPMILRAVQQVQDRAARSGHRQPNVSHADIPGFHAAAAAASSRPSGMGKVGWPPVPGTRRPHQLAISAVFRVQSRRAAGSHRRPPPGSRASACCGCHQRRRDARRPDRSRGAGRSAAHRRCCSW